MYTNYISPYESESGNETWPHFARNAFGVTVNNKNLDSVTVTYGAYSFREGADVSELEDSYSCKSDAVKFYSRRC
jgi:hypothetical protein